VHQRLAQGLELLGRQLLDALKYSRRQRPKALVDLHTQDFPLPFLEPFFIRGQIHRLNSVVFFAKGLEKGQREILRMQIDERFGPLSPAVLERIEQLPAEQLKPLGKALVHAQSLRDLGLEE
jgi:hypothetical protein